MSDLVRVYAATGTAALAVQLWQMQILSLYLFAICGDTRLVGVAEGAQGASRLIFAMVAGVIIDICPRNALLRTTAVLGLGIHAWVGALVLLPPATWHIDRMQLWFASLAVYAVYGSLQMTLTDCIFADSVPSGDRVTPYTRRNLLRQACMAVSPLVQLVFFVALGTETWDETTLRPVMLCGVAIGASSALLLATLDQRRTLGAASEALHLHQPAVTPEPAGTSTLNAALLRNGASPCGCGSGEADVPGRLGRAEGATESDVSLVEGRAEGATESDVSLVEGRSHGEGGVAVPHSADDATTSAADAQHRSAALVRWSIAGYDLVRVCSGGLIVKYWGLFFAAEYGMSPAALALMQLAVFVAMLSVTFVAGRLCADGPHGPAHRRGAIIMLLLLLCDAGNFVTACVHSLPCDVVGWVVREATLNAVLGLKRSLLMDHTPKGTRGRWNALESLTGGFWSGTAVVGGFIIHACADNRCLPADHHGYRTALLVMAGGFLLASVVWMPLVRFR